MQVWTNTTNQDGSITGTKFGSGCCCGTCTSTTVAVATTHATNTTTTTTPAVSTPAGAVSGSIATNNGTSVLCARNLDGRPLLAAIAAPAPTTTPVLPVTSPPLTQVAARTDRLRKGVMRTALTTTNSATRNNALAVHGMTLRNTPTIQTQIQDSIDEGMSTKEAGKFLLLSRQPIAVHSSKK